MKSDSTKWACIGLFVFAVAVSSCKKEGDEGASTPSAPEAASTPTSPGESASTPSATPSAANPLISEGKTIYQSRCIACHNTDPKKVGALGPEVFGSSLALLEARVVTGTYPAGYTPKRATKMMVPLPDLKDKLAALHAYLNN